MVSSLGSLCTVLVQCCLCHQKKLPNSLVKSRAPTLSMFFKSPGGEGACWGTEQQATLPRKTFLVTLGAPGPPVRGSPSCGDTL